MVDLIDRQRAIAKFEPWLKVDGYSEGELNMLKAVLFELTVMPSAQLEIVRCKDCKWQKDQSGSTAWLPCMALVTPSDFYCGRAERREDD